MLTGAVTEVVDHPCIKHSWASSTAIYTSVGSDYRNRVLQRALAARLPVATAGQEEGR